MIKNKKQTKTIIWEIDKLLFGFCLVFSILYFGFAQKVHAQTLGLSISPPIDEIMIMPGKEVTRTFTITNDGESGMASIYIVPFRAQGENGNVALDEKNAVTGLSPFASWFSIISPVTSFGEKFYMTGGQTQTVTIKISPGVNAVERDYYFTLLYELDNDIPGGFTPIGPTNQARIGANLLLSISKDGKPVKNPYIAEFSAPKVIDSLGSLIYKIRIGNNGSYVFKSNGKITIKPTFGTSETLNLAPLNIISDSIRSIPCLSGEEMISCQSNHKVLIGIYKSTLSIIPDGEGDPQTKTVTTVAFPFSILFGLILVAATYKIIRKSQKTGKESS